MGTIRQPDGVSNSTQAAFVRAHPSTRPPVISCMASRTLRATQISLDRHQKVRSEMPPPEPPRFLR